MTIRDNNETGSNEAIGIASGEELLREEERMAARAWGGERQPDWNPKERLDVIDAFFEAYGGGRVPMGILVED